VETETPSSERLYTSSEVGALLQVDPSSVKKWVDTGHLSAFRTPGGHRRIRAQDLLAFLDRHGMPVPRALRDAARRTVVVVDDDLVQLRALARRLRRAAPAVQVDAIADPLDALVRIGAMQPHAVVVDVLMPRLSGLELCRALRKSAPTRGVTVIAVSALCTPALVAEARAAGAHHVLAKPIEPGLLLDAIGIAAEDRR
jgi:excisionase family DNA binding protein